MVGSMFGKLKGMAVQTSHDGFETPTFDVGIDMEKEIPKINFNLDKDKEIKKDDKKRRTKKAKM